MKNSTLKRTPTIKKRAKKKRAKRERYTPEEVADMALLAFTLIFSVIKIHVYPQEPARLVGSGRTPDAERKRLEVAR